MLELDLPVLSHPDFLRENNAKIRQQYEALTKWKEKVHDANVVNKEKFEQTRALITALRKENEELQKKYADTQEENVSGLFIFSISEMRGSA